VSRSAGVCRTARARTHTRAYARAHARTHARTHTHTHARTHENTHARTHARIHAHTRTYSILGSEEPASCSCASQWALTARVCVSQLLRFVLSLSLSLSLSHTHTHTHTQLPRSAWHRGLMPRRSVRRCCHRDQGQDCTKWAAGHEPRLRHRPR
jgi:hypothetical protein